MNFQWLEMRIQEERDRREKESLTLARLPAAMEELHASLAECVGQYTEIFGKETVQILMLGSKIKLTCRDEVEGHWQTRVKIEIFPAPEVPGFRVERPGEPLIVEVGLLAADKIFYRIGDEYIGIEEVTRRILDRALFPKLPE